MDGTEGERAGRTRSFAEKLRQRVDVPVEFMDERLTTVEADGILEESGVRREIRKQMIDQVAAQLILESWLHDHPEDTEGYENG